jgi:hypothetical protein
MNVNECKSSKLNDGLECIFRVVNIDNTGMVVGHQCAIKSKDTYNIKPETDSDGEINYQPVNHGDPIRAGDQAVIWESLSHHQTGKSYEGEMAYNPGMEFHPLYSVSEHNFPTKYKLGTTDIGEIFGEENPTLVHAGWSEQKFYGKSNVEYCKLGIYGRFDKSASMVMHKALRSHIDVPGFINYGITKKRTRKVFFLETASIEDILIYARGTFHEKKVADRMAEGMIISKEGTFINLYVMMKNNFATEAEVKKFMSEVSFETLDSIYKTKPDIEMFYNLYINLHQLQLQTRILNKDLKEIVTTAKIDPNYVRLYKENIVNWILNYPKWKEVIPGLESRYPRDQRYWFLRPLLYRALRVDKVLDPSIKLPDWLLNILKETNDLKVNVFGEQKEVSQLPDDLQSDLAIAKHNYLASSSPIDAIMSMYPGMLSIKSEMKAAGFDPKEVGSQGWGQFVRILKAGRIWTMLEILTAWERFVPSWIDDQPVIFYEWLDKVAHSPIDPMYSLTQEELDTITKKHGIASVEAGPQEVIEESDTLDTIEGQQKKKAFAGNILSVSNNWEEWTGWEDYDADRIPVQSWYDTTIRIKSSRENSGDTSWNMLAKLAARGAIFKKDYKNIRSKLSDETHEEAIHPDTDIVVNDGVHIMGIDLNDRTDITGYNHSTDEYNAIQEGGSVCQGEE